MTEASPKELWAAVKATRGDWGCQASYPPSLLLDLDSVNNYFASICYDQYYSSDSVNYFPKSIINQDCKIALAVYEVERLLYHIKPSSPGLDNIPTWIYHNCSYEIAHVVAHILNFFLFLRTVPLQWRQAVVTPVPKVAKPSTLSEYRPISVTPLLFRVA